IDTTELNSVVIDIKDYSGSVSFEVGANCYVSDLKEFVSKLHQAGVYVIGRIAVFQDPRYTTSHPELAVKSLATGEVWKDYKGLSFIDVGAKPYWDYIVQISKASYELGFDELNYDYVRYPSDGDMEDADFTWMTASSAKPEMLESFFSYLYDNLQTYNLKTSVDLFGMTTTVTSDMGIGQVLEKALPYFDYIAPMVYPSHYPASWNGFVNPAEHPYEVIHLAMSEGKRREEIWRLSNNLATSTTSKLRPWLQDFNLGATYDATKVRAQIQATYDSGLTSWMIWSAANKYTKEALLRE
ncbi:MAG: putative glycoside hydrolase, partial [Patescibacteria group bacterium]